MKIAARPFAWVALALASACSTAPGPGGSASPAPAADAVQVRISYGSEKKAFLTDSADAFHRSSPRTRSGKPIHVELIAEGSAESMESILAGRKDLTVWSPASSLLVDVLNDRWAEKGAATGTGAVRKVVPEAPSLVLSPVVIAMWEPMARALGWPEKAVGWGEIGAFATSGAGWSRFGHPEWGAFKFGHTHPRYSNSGALALLAATYAGAGKTRDMQPADVDRAAPFVRRVQASVVHYGRSTGFFADKMFARGPGYLSAAVLYENLVVESATSPKYRDKPFPVVAVYPREGTFWSDHPYAILDVPSVTPEQREGAEAFRAFLLAPERQRAAMTRFGFRPVDPSIALGSPLDAAHGIDPAQPKNVLPNPTVAVTRRVLEGFESVKRPVSITFVIDTSGSMAGDPLKQAKAGARLFLESLPDADAARVMLFSNAPHWVSDRPEKLAASRPRLVQAIESSFADGGTALYDSLLQTFAPAPGEEKGAARAVVVLTDGEDTDSKVKLDALLAMLGQRASEGGAPGEETPRIFTIAYGAKADVGALQRLAEAGGGAFFSGTPKDIRAVYAELATFF
ncbi:MAG TPA: extracellular solute-binding protein [Vicinamibacteria bacterium]|nr:extracellular solute-binding protein [Vicinamibacteria bacterium]